jgi:hypothetical protein
MEEKDGNENGEKDIREGIKEVRTGKGIGEIKEKIDGRERRERKEMGDKDGKRVHRYKDGITPLGIGRD